MLLDVRDLRNSFLLSFLCVILLCNKQFQFVDFSAIRAKHKNPAGLFCFFTHIVIMRIINIISLFISVFSLAAFMELPDQYTYIKNHIFVTKDYLSLPIVYVAGIFIRTNLKLLRVTVDL